MTCIKPIRGFLHIYGHKKPELLTQLDLEISAYQPYTKRIAVQPDLHPNLEFDTVYLALSAGNNQYHRCIVREKRPHNKAIIELIDYGSDFEVDTSFVSIYFLKRKLMTPLGLHSHQCILRFKMCGVYKSNTENSI